MTAVTGQPHDRDATEKVLESSGLVVGSEDGQVIDDNLDAVGELTVLVDLMHQNCRGWRDLEKCCEVGTRGVASTEDRHVERFRVVHGAQSLR
jgi:hypothetical protein